MKYLKTLRFSFIPIFFLTTCNVGYFYSDPDDYGLSRFTSHGGHVATCYINEKPYINNNVTYYPLLQKDSGANSIDTLVLKWSLSTHDSLPSYSFYQNISFLLPVPASFNKTNLLGLNGQRFLNSVPVTMQDTSLNKLSGVGTLYFVKVTEKQGYSNQKSINLSGLFDANIGDSILITKGRFDFEIDEDRLNF